MPETNHQILLANRPSGAASTSGFQSAEVPLAPVTYGQVRVRDRFLSLAPYTFWTVTTSASDRRV
jgi:hypothetical protein